MEWHLRCWWLATMLLVVSGCGGTEDSADRAELRETNDPTGEQGGEVCDNDDDDDGDGVADCADNDCSRHRACVEIPDEDCSNLIDDDQDGDSDCNDSDCESSDLCRATNLELCANDVDDDGDTAIDCADADCASDPACLSTCGNRLLDDGEVCDGTILGSCDPVDEICRGCACVPRPYCGDNRVNRAVEWCDGTDLGRCLFGVETCTVRCTCEPRCGNGAVDEGEQCDGDLLGSCNPDVEYCNSACQCQNDCGDYYIDPLQGEECDASDDHCDVDEICLEAYCLCVEPFCGDNRLGDDEDCDPGVLPTSSGIPCQDTDLVCNPETCDCVTSYCGDGRITGDEACDFPSEAVATGCEDEVEDPLCDPFECSCVDAVCGDGAITGAEVCDWDTETGLAVGCVETSELPICWRCACIADSCPAGVEPASPDPTEEDPNRWSVTTTVPTGAGDYTACSGGEGAEIVYQITPPQTGTYFFTTDTLATRASGASLVLTLQSHCHANANPLICDDEIMIDLPAGIPVYLVVDTDTDEVGLEFAVDWGLVTSVGEAEDCDERFAFCDEGLVCIEEACEVSVAPALTAYSVVATSDNEHRHTFEGTDPNRDLAEVVVFSFDGSGELIYGPLTYSLQPEAVVYDGENGAFSAELQLTGVEGLGIAQYSAWVVDSDQNQSQPPMTANVETGE